MARNHSIETIGNRTLTFDELPEIITPKQISNYLGVCYTKGLNIVQYSGLDYLKIDNTYLVTKIAFKEWLQAKGQRVISVDR